MAAALADITTAIERNPKSGSAFNLRAAIHSRLGNFQGALADHLTAHELDPDEVATLNYLAWLRATCPLDEVRDGAAALRDATRACELTDYQAPGYLDTLAAAHAELGNFEEAIRWQEKALKLVSAAQHTEYESRLELYKSGKSYRDEATKPANS
jgi:tetratricopeptide (TPR) repeat protein